jgi:hypothetical protein
MWFQLQLDSIWVSPDCQMGCQASNITYHEWVWNMSLLTLCWEIFLKNLSLKKSENRCLFNKKIIIKSGLGYDKLWNSQSDMNEILFLYMCKFDLLM